MLMMPPGTASNSRVTTASRFRVIGGLARLIAGLILAAMVTLSDRFMWARRALERVRRRVRNMGLPERPVRSRSGRNDSVGSARELGAARWNTEAV